MKAAVRDLGVMDYAACRALQQELFEELGARKSDRRENSGPVAENCDAPNRAGTILLVEHPPVYTLGKSGRAENLLVDPATLERLGAGFFHIDRGGDITFHGPGQLVCYPILDLECLGIGLREYIGRLEEAVIRTVAHYGIAAGRIAGASGVWLGGPAAEGPAAGGPAGAIEEATAEANEKRSAPRKICAIGVRASRYVTMHGLALNVTTDLAWFSHINPCGFRDRGVTSIARETGREVPMSEVKELLLRELGRQLGITLANEGRGITICGKYSLRRAPAPAAEECNARGVARERNLPAKQGGPQPAAGEAKYGCRLEKLPCGGNENEENKC